MTGREGRIGSHEPSRPAAPPARDREHVVVVAPEEAGTRLDRLLQARLPGLSRSRIQALIRGGHVGTAEGTLGEPGRRVKPGEAIRVREPEAEPAEPRAEAMPLAVVHEDSHLIVVDKPAGLVVHPAAGHAAGTLVNALLAHCGDSLSGIGGVKRPGIVHRLDKDTSGLLVIAKTDRAHQGLAAQFAAHGRDGQLERAYLAIAWGVPRHQRGRIAARLGRSQANRTRMAVVGGEGGREAVTHFERLEVLEAGTSRPVAALLRCVLETGRTHQIRVHLAHLGHPVLGDATYGAGFAASVRGLPEPARAALAGLGRQALHAAVLGFVHPVTGKRLRFESPLPAELARLLALLRG